jgi:hypothetical protein
VKKLHNNKGNSKEGKGDTQAKPKDEPWLSLSFKYANSPDPKKR